MGLTVTWGTCNRYHLNIYSFILFHLEFRVYSGFGREERREAQLR